MKMMIVNEDMTHETSKIINEESYANMSSTFTSCIVFKGKPILPPVMTPLIRSEMSQYKEMAIHVEQRLRKRLAERGTTSDLATNELNDSRSMNEIGCDENWETESQTPDPQRHSRLLISCSPSVASTDLAKYMNATCENVAEDSSLWSECPDPDVIVSSANMENSITQTSAVICETLDEDQDTGEITEEESPPPTVTEDFVDEEEAYSSSSPIRRGSYTLEQPSPVLVAYLKELNIECNDNSTNHDHLVSNSDDSPTQVHPVKVSNENGSHDSPPLDSSIVTKSESPKSQSLFTNLFTMHHKDLGMADEKHYQKHLGDLIRKHDEALEELKRNFLQAATNLVQSAPNKTENKSFESRPQSNQVPAQVTGPTFCSNVNLHTDTIYNSQISESSWDTSVEETKTDTVQPNFDRVSAAVKGYLTRRLLKTTKVQAIVKTIKDTLEFAVELHADTPLNDGCVTPQDAELHERLIAQLSSACYEFHDVFFKTTIKDRMSLIAQDRALLQEKLFREVSLVKPSEGQHKHRKLSSATIKALERRRRRSNDSRNSISPRAWRIYKSRSPRESPLIKERYRRNLESELRSYTASPQLSTQSSYYVEQRSLSAMSEILSSHHTVRRSLDYNKQPVVRKVKTKRQLIQRPFLV